MYIAMLHEIIDIALASREQGSEEMLSDEGCLEEGLDGELALYRMGRRNIFKFDRVFGMDSTQEQVYEDTKALIRSVLDGKSFRFS